MQREIDIKIDFYGIDEINQVKKFDINKFWYDINNRGTTIAKAYEDKTIKNINGFNFYNTATNLIHSFLFNKPDSVWEFWSGDKTMLDKKIIVLHNKLESEIFNKVNTKYKSKADWVEIISSLKMKEYFKLYFEKKFNEYFNNFSKNYKIQINNYTVKEKTRIPVYPIGDNSVRHFTKLNFDVLDYNLNQIVKSFELKDFVLILNKMA